MSRPALRALLPFNDDSTLFFAVRMRQMLAGSGIAVALAWFAHRSDLSPRQLASVLPEGPDLLLHPEAFRCVEALADYDMILTSRIFPSLQGMMRNPFIRHRADRPAVLAFQGGLDFDPERGFFNRRHVDAVFVVPRTQMAAYRRWSGDGARDGPEDGAKEGIGEGAQYLGFGHPTFLSPNLAPDLAPDTAPPEPGQDIYFFAQAVSPVSRRGRQHIVQVLAALARAHRDRTIWVKLRHLPHENKDHLHRERYPYPALLRAAGADDLANLKVTAAPMDKVLPRVGIGLTCTSTAAIDLVRAGVPTMVYLDGVENYLDPMTQAMRHLFATSGLIATLDDVLHLRTQPPDPSWLQGMFCPPAQLIAQIYEAVAHFRDRPDLVDRILPAQTPQV